MERIRATLRLDGDELRVDTNSEGRLDRGLDTLRRLDPSITVLRESRKPASDAREVMALAGTEPPESPFLDPADPEVAAMLDQFGCDYERTWLDQPVPALAGLTPRAAAADPTRRPDLVRLLNSFPDDGQPGTMNPTRLRAALGLE